MKSSSILVIVIFVCWTPFLIPVNARRGGGDRLERGGHRDGGHHRTPGGHRGGDAPLDGDGGPPPPPGGGPPPPPGEGGGGGGCRNDPCPCIPMFHLLHPDNTVQNDCRPPPPQDYNCDPNEKYRLLDGSCNNLNRPHFGQAGRPFRRLLEAEYDDGRDHPLDIGQPNARLAAEEIFIAFNGEGEDVERPLNSPVNQFCIDWGQFMAHEMSLTAASGGNGACLTDGPAAAATGRKSNIDPICYSVNGSSTCTESCCICSDQAPKNCGLCLDGAGAVVEADGRLQGQIMHFNRTDSCTDGAGVRQQINAQTPFIDASVIYGVDQNLLTLLRDDAAGKGRLKTNDNFGFPIMPDDSNPATYMSCHTNSQNQPCFLCGDPRCDDVHDLIGMHCLFLREHNRIADALTAINSAGTSAETIFQETRKIIGALMQMFTYDEWLPLIVGTRNCLINQAQSYDDHKDPTLANAFSTGAARFGHPFIFNMQPFCNEAYYNCEEESSKSFLDDNFWAPNSFVNEFDPVTPCESKWRGMLWQEAKSHLPNLYNEYFPDLFFHQTFEPAQDLAARNLHRNREHGLANHNAWRRWCKIPEWRSWQDVADSLRSDTLTDPRDGTTTKSMIQLLEQVYGASGWEKIELYLGGILEAPVDGGLVGPTFQCILIEQYRRMKEGDRFFYEFDPALAGAKLETIKQYSLSKMMCNNGFSGAQVVPINAFLNVKTALTDTCSNLLQNDLDLTLWTGL